MSFGSAQFYLTWLHFHWPGLAVMYQITARAWCVHVLGICYQSIHLADTSPRWVTTFKWLLIGFLFTLPSLSSLAASIGRLQNWRAIIFSRVCLSVCLCVSDRHFYPSTLTDFDETWSQGPHCDLVWPDHNGPDRPQRDRATPFWKFQKILQNHRILIFKTLVDHFLHLCQPCTVKKSTRFEQIWRRR